jgi:hypothetical protein
MYVQNVQKSSNILYGRSIFQLDNYGHPTVGDTVIKLASQRTLIRLGSFDSSNIAFSPKKSPVCGNCWLVK